MTKEELNYIKDSFSQILDDIGGNPDWYDAAKAVASDLGTMEKQLEERVTKLPSNLDEAAEKFGLEYAPIISGEALDLSGQCCQFYETDDVDRPLRCGFIKGFKAGAEWMAGQFECVGSYAIPDERGGYWPSDTYYIKKK